MRDDAVHDPLQDLFSGSGAEEFEEDLGGAASADLTTAGLFSSAGGGGERDAGEPASAPIEASRPVQDAAAAQVAAQREPRPGDAEGDSLAPAPALVAGRASTRGTAGPLRDSDQQPGGRAEAEELIGSSLPLQEGGGDAYWELEGAPVDREILRERQRILKVLLGGAALVGVVSITATFLGPTLRVGQWLAFALPFAFLAVSILILYSLSARAERRLHRLLSQQGSALCAARAMSAERQQALERASIALCKQEHHVELGAAVGRLATMGLSVDEMMAHAVALIQQETGADYVGLYVLDRDRTYAELRAQASTLPELARSIHEATRITDDVLLRQCVSSGRPRIVLGVDQVRGLPGGSDSAALRHGIRSALALPLIARGTVFGVVSVQSVSAAAFSGDDLTALRNAADQVAIGISNAQLVAALRDSLVQLEDLQRRHAGEAWDPFPAVNAPSLYEYHRPGLRPLEDDGPWPDGVEARARPRLTAIDGADSSAPSMLLVPIALREQVLGVLGLHRGDDDVPWTEEQLELLTAVSEQMGLVIENSRLFAEARSRAARERQAREIATRLRRSLDTEEILSTAVREIGAALGLKDVTVRLTGAEERAGE